MKIKPGVNPIKLKILQNYRKKFFFCNEFDFNMLKRVTNALASH